MSDDRNIVTISNEFVVVDTETTGLNPRIHDLLEIAYAVGDAPVQTIRLPWWFTTWANADPRALTVNKWFEREKQAEAPRKKSVSVYGMGWDDVPGIVQDGHFFEAALCEYTDTQHNETMRVREQIMKFMKATEGKLMVGAAVNFDVNFLSEFFYREENFGRLNLPTGYKFEPSHRLWDVQIYAAGKFGWDKSRSLRETIAFVNDGTPIVRTAPDHTAAADVEATRDLFRVLTNRM